MESYRDYRIREHEGFFYGIPPALGDPDLIRNSERNQLDILSAAEAADLRSSIDNLLDPPQDSAEKHILERNYKGYDLYQYGVVCIACSSESGGPDFETWRNCRDADFFAGDNAEEVKLQIDAGSSTSIKEYGSGLLVCSASPERLEQILENCPFEQVTLLKTPQQAGLLPSLPSIDLAQGAAELLPACRDRNFDAFLMPVDNRLENKPWEGFAKHFVDKIYAAFPDGQTHLYQADHFNRIQYNMAYLRGFYRFARDLQGKRIIEIGCSDGLTCDLIAHENPALVNGIDMLDTVGLLYPHVKARYDKMSAEEMDFEDDTFDYCYSIATFEHVSDPVKALNEIRRVTKPGGTCYIQAGPLYHSPFGHHMFGTFDADPWIHLKQSRPQIVQYYKSQLEKSLPDKARRPQIESYVDAMLSVTHVNGLFLREYHLSDFIQGSNVDLVHYSESKEGEDLLDAQTIQDLEGIDPSDLTLHGFELVFKVR